ncbi:MAG: energy-coupling factor transporter transmembrane component T [Gordonia sp. (in: high G+C Gram-positive bacteria)]|uniref:energy-coupling factor transporter transmembrane component T n=1 Tax=Gordonia sp. (in: high G+C Gram-positive bacteria) TaxID=84139 RepID=UPI0039E2D83A
MSPTTPPVPTPPVPTPPPPARLPERRRTGLTLDPRTTLLLMGFVAVAELLRGSDWFVAAVAAIPVVLLAQNRQHRLALWYLVLFTLAVLVKRHQADLSIPMALNMIAVLLTGFVLKLAPAFAMAAYFLATTTASEFVAALGRIGVGRAITVPISVIFRLLPTMREEFGSIDDAMRMRGIGLGTRKFWRNPAALVEYRFIPLVISLAKIGNELSAAALTRGLDRPGPHTSIARIGITPVDVIVVVAAATLLTTTFLLT